jgi:hypothetical protein
MEELDAASESSVEDSKPKKQPAKTKADTAAAASKMPNKATAQLPIGKAKLKMPATKKNGSVEVSNSTQASQAATSGPVLMLRRSARINGSQPGSSQDMVDNGNGTQTLSARVKAPATKPILKLRGEHDTTNGENVPQKKRSWGSISRGGIVRMEWGRV